MVDVFLLTADNTDITELVRLCRHPPVRELGEVDDKYVIGTAEVLSSPQREVWKPKQRNAPGIPKGWQEVTLSAIHKTMDKGKAYGIDKVTKEEYERNLDENLANLVKRMKSGSYRPNPTRRVYIPKETKGIYLRTSICIMYWTTGLT